LFAGTSRGAASIVAPVSAFEPLRTAVLVSGAGTNLQALIDTVHHEEVEIVAVASSRRGVEALQRAEAAGIATAVFARSEYPDRVARDLALADWLDAAGARLIVLAGYMELLSEEFLDRFRDAVINVHPSLLPAFPGLHAVEQAIAYGVKVFGVTVHFVDSGVDTGPIIAQSAIELEEASDPAKVLNLLHPIEHRLLIDAVRRFAAGCLRVDGASGRSVVRSG
jgi:phosphoribosylglycinamide formyltransferase-1